MSLYYADRFAFVKESVESILNQSFRNFDYYIAFDGPVSDDIDSYISSLKDSRVKLHRLESNRGLAFALNYLLEIVLERPEVKFIARMDGDDVSLPERFEKQRAFLLEHKDIACVGCWYKEINEDGKVLSLKRLPVEHEKLVKRYYTRAPFAHPSVMYRRDLIDRAGFYPEDTLLMEDNVLWGNAIACGLKFSNLPEYLFLFRKDKNFYNRRSGFKYGSGFIRTRFKINKKLKFPLYSYFLLIIVGIIKMMPSFVNRGVNGLLRV